MDLLGSYELIFYLAGSEVALAGAFLAVATHCCLSPITPPGQASDPGDAEDPSSPQAMELETG